MTSRKDWRNTPESNAEAVERLRSALKLIEEAQHTLERAAQALSPVCGGSPTQTKIARQAQRTHDLWRFIAYRVRDAGKARRWFMDGMGSDGMERRPANANAKETA